LKTGLTDITGFSSYTLNGTVNYNGDGDTQNLVATTYNNLTLAVNTGSLASASGTKVTGTLTFTSGTIDATTNALTLSASATASSTDASFVKGSVIRETDGSVTSFFFPVANGSNERGVKVNFSSAPASGNSLTATAKGSMSSPTSTLSGVKSVEADGYWTISASGFTPSSYTLTVNTDGFSPAITSSSNVSIVRGTAETFNDELGSSESSAVDAVTASFGGTNLGDFAIANLVGTFTWDGGGADNNWSTDANWVGDAEPQAGDKVLFDHSSLSGAYSVVFDGASTDATNFSEITLNGGGTDGITLTFSSGTIDLNGTAVTVGDGDKLVFGGSTVNNFDSGNTTYNSGSTVEYSAGTTVYSDAYHHLVISNASGSLSTSEVISVAGNFTKSGAGTFSSGYTFTVTGTSTIQAGTFSGNGALTFNGTFTISGGAFSPGGDVSFNDDVTLSGGTFTPSSTTEFKGTTLTGSGSSVSNSSGKITFNGSAAQTISISSGTGNLTFYDIEVNNASGLSISTGTADSVRVDGTLTITAGSVTTGTGTTNNLVLKNSVSGGDQSNYINGIAYISRSTSNVEVPTGNNGKMRIVGVTPNAENETYAVRFINAAPGNRTNLSGLNRVSDQYYWTISRISTSGSATIRLYWEGTADGVDGALSDLRVARYNGSNWVDEGNTAASGSAASGYVVSGTVSSFSDFTLGSAAGDNSLPVELSSFTAENAGTGVRLAWHVQSELDNQSFMIERRDKENSAEYELIAEIDGRGTASDGMDYEYMDEEAEDGVVYEYRLLSRDYNGLVHEYESGLVEITAEIIPDGFVLNQNYPNPFNPTTTISFSLSEPAKVTLNIYNVNGQLVRSLVKNSGLSPSRYDYTWDGRDMAGSQVSSGLYFYRLIINSGQKILTKKMLLVK
jgi:hypothetical protein